MISFNRKENKVIVNVEHGIFGTGDYFDLDINQFQPYQAELLRQAFQDNLNRHLENIKRKYYNLGWKHAKAKTSKWTHFFGGWEKP